MAVIQKAIGIAWGIGAGVTVTAAALLSVKPLNANYNRGANVVELPNQDGESIGLVFFNQTNELELRVYPSGVSLAAAITAGGTMGLSPGSAVTIAATDDPDLVGTYVCTKVGKTRKTDGYVEFDISIKEWPTDISTTIAS